MINFSFKHVGGKNLTEMSSDLEKLPADLKTQVYNLAVEAKEMMGQIIETSRKRDSQPTNKPHLSELIEVEVITDTDTEYKVGVGNIETIEKKYRDPANPKDNGKGWMLLNWGGMPGKGKNPVGVFGDGASNPEAEGKSRFQYGHPGGRLYPKNPVVGIHFIETTINQLAIKFASILARFK